jgi:preprotein translocase subunit SecG
MDTFNVLALIAHVLIAAAIIGLVLLQKGKGADAGAGFGAGASGTVFGARGSANFLSRSTAVMATLFFASSLGLAYLNSNRQVETSVLDSVVTEESVGEQTSVEFEMDDLDLPPLPESSDDSGADDSVPVVPE